MKRILFWLPIFLFALFVPTMAFAQTAPVVQLTVYTGLVSVLTLLAGFVGQTVSTQSFLGIKQVSTGWIPFLTLGGSFLTGFVHSLSAAGGLTGTSLFNAAIAGLAPLTTAGVGVAAAMHVTSHQKPSGPDAKTAKSTASPTSPAKPSTTSRVALGAWCALWAIVGVIACTTQQAQSADAVAIDLTNAVCAVAQDQPTGQPWTDVVCTVAGGVEQGLGVALDGIPTATTLTSQAPNIKTVRIRIPSTASAAFLAEHHGVTAAMPTVRQ
jgi:hypothetical protein